MKATQLFLALLISASSIAAQSTQPCSAVSIESVDKVDSGAPLVFLARGNEARAGAQYKWQLSAGTILAGAETSTLTVDTAGLGGIIITATVETTAGSTACRVSKSVMVIPPPITCGLAFAEYGDIRFQNEKARLDNFAIQLLNSPSDRGAIIVHAGNPTYKGEAADRLLRAKNYLVKVRGIDPERILTIDAGYNTDLTTHLYIAPEGAPVPALESNVPIGEVRFTKRKPPARTPRSTNARRRP